MKIDMKKFFLVLLLSLFCIIPAFAQGTSEPPPPPTPCVCCEDLDVDSQAYADCAAECLAGEDPCVPINASITLLLIAGISLGLYVVKNKKATNKNNVFI
jgi:hypothetical protein